MKWDEEQLQRFLRKQTIIRLYSRFVAGHFHGYLAGWSEEWLMIKDIHDTMQVNGFTVFRRTALKELVEAPYQKFVREAIELRGRDWPSHQIGKDMDLSDSRSIIESACSKFPLVTIHIEREDPNVCYIGREPGFDKKRLYWTEIDPDARLEKDSSSHKLKDITRIEFGGLYEKALWMVYESRMSKDK